MLHLECSGHGRVRTIAKARTRGADTFMRTAAMPRTSDIAASELFSLAIAQ